jgi:competence protein ComFC
MGFGTICYFCKSKKDTRFCDGCLKQVSPNFKMLPTLPNICLGGYLFDYLPALKIILRDLKFNGNFRLGAWLKKTNYEYHIPGIFFDTDAIIYVKSYWLKQILRGKPHIPFLFDQTLAKKTNKKNYLRRIKYSTSSYKLQRQERIIHAKKSRFCWNAPKNIKAVTILDDIVTTGATVSEIAKLLKDAGVKTIMVLSLCYQTIEDISTNKDNN